jgi:hypothetical protein
MLDPADRVPQPVRDRVQAALAEEELSLWGADSTVARALEIWT